MGTFKLRNRRPFIWQDEMVEVKNLFRKVSKVRSSGFTGFSVWKDEPTAETLSRNRLRRRRAQYALDMTHLNYSESPYEALTHLHNIRGMCSRIQRQDLNVERKKKDYDAQLHPSLLRRPVTALAGNSVWDRGHNASTSRRPSSAPHSLSTPLHYTAPKPTVLYDATIQRNSRYGSSGKRPSSSVSSSRSGRSVQSERKSAWDCPSSAQSTPVTPSTSKNQSTRPSSSPSASLSVQMNGDYRNKHEHTTQQVPQIMTTDHEVSTSGFIASDFEVSSRELPSHVEFPDQESSRMQERPPSRPGSKRPPRYQQKVTRNSYMDRNEAYNLLAGSDTAHTHDTTMLSDVPDSPGSYAMAEVCTPTGGKSQMKTEKSGTSDQSSGLWALTQQRPKTADASTHRRPERVDQRVQPTYPHSESAELTETCNPKPNSCDSSSNLKAATENGLPSATVSPFQNDCTEGRLELEQEAARRAPRSNSEVCDSRASSSYGEHGTENTSSESAGEDSHILIKHSTDPYSDFKTSMMQMINEEGLIDKQWELEELFQYYMDLNPVIHHEILRRVINDIKKDLAVENALS